MNDIHMSDCATHNMPASPNGACDCEIEFHGGESVHAWMKRTGLNQDDAIQVLHDQVMRSKPSIDRLSDVYDAALPLMIWLQKNSHPHMQVQVSQDRVELMEGIGCHLFSGDDRNGGS